MKRIAEKLDECQTFLVVTHINPDADALGSLTAMGLILRDMGKKFNLYCENTVPSFACFLPLIEQVKESPCDPKEYDAVIALDCADIHRAGKKLKGLKDADCLINLDHHVTNRNFGTLNVVDPEASSVCELVYRLVKMKKFPLSDQLSTSLYTGIYSDTGAFSFSNTSKTVLSVCADLAAHGADPFFIAKNINTPFSRNRLDLFRLYLEKTEFSENGKLAIVYLSKELYDQTSTSEMDSGELINSIKNVENVKVAVQIQDVLDTNAVVRKNLFRVSLRSDGDVDVAEIASEFGGGGHRCASGFSAHKKMSALKKYFRKLAQTL